MLNFPDLEKKILKFWREKKIFEKLRKKNQGKERWSFLDGPITANNPMGVHHAWGRTYKDLFQRYKAMQGYNLRYQNGFDCQGLHVEVEVEKELGFKTKKDIEKYGIDKFVEKCKERVKKYSKIQTEQSIRLGQWMDWDNSYYTMSDENNYAIWGFLKKCWEKGLLYKGRDVVPWCPRCGTAISEHEILTEEYKEITHKAVYVKFKLKNRHNTYFLVWTTTPWTLPGNAALAVHPKLIYVRVQDKNNDNFILLKEKVSLIPEKKIIEEFRGEKLKGQEYEPIFPDLSRIKTEEVTTGSIGGNKERNTIILWEDVNLEEGTGIVHIAPGCGQEDFKLSKEHYFAPITLTDENSNYRQGFDKLSGKFVGSPEVKDWIIDNLRGKKLFFKVEDYKHRYPTCWRCKSELIFRLVDEWYIAMDEPSNSKFKIQNSKFKKPLREKLIDVAKKINWIPKFGLDRELDWLKNMQDWLISKKRYWGLALPIWVCKKCMKGEDYLVAVGKIRDGFEVIGSKEELKKRVVEGWDKFGGKSPHKPWIDEIKIKCKCGELMSRIPDVGNPWLDAGIVPFSTMPKEWFPADLVCESFPGQFKNWFYSIITMSTVLEGVAPVKTIFGYALVRDEKSEEMHKSKGNAIWFDEAVEKIGADPMRWMYSKQNPAYNLNFGYKAAEEIKRKLLNLYNSFTFFTTYVEKKDFPEGEPKLNPKNILDVWIISRLNNLIDKVSKNLDKYNVAAAVLAIEDFFIEDLSLWYIRRSRKRFHSTAPKKQRKEAIETLYYVFLDLIKIIAPIMPFFAEEMYSVLKTENMPESVHLCDWPEAEKEKFDKELEEKMAETREIVAQALSQRAEAGIKVRQPVALLKIKNQKSKIKNNKKLLELIKEEVNVKKIVFDSKIKKEIELDTKITPWLKEEGMVRDIIRNIQEMRKKAGYTPKDRILIQASGDFSLEKILRKNKKLILEETKADKIEFGEEQKQVFTVKEDFKIDQKNIQLAIKKTK